MAMSLLSHLRHRLADWFAEAVPPTSFERDDRVLASHAQALDAPSWGAQAQDAQADEARRTSIHDVTLEQLGLAHWSCHALF